MALTAVEILEHPAFESVIWDLKPTKKGTCTVAKARGSPVNIAYETHGDGLIRLVWIMGLGAFKWYWQHQTKNFGHDQGSRYPCPIFDNRGMGESDKPLAWYSTSGMAEGSLELLQHLETTMERQLHFIGISMGGTIAQELAYRAPKRIASLSLISTAAQLINTIIYLAHLWNRINIFVPKSLDAQHAEVKSRVSITWLSEPDVDGDFPTNGDRFAAQELTKRHDKAGLTHTGFLCQAVAVSRYCKTKEQLQYLADEVGRERIQVLHGTADNLITVPHAHVSVDWLEGKDTGVTKIIFEGRGHYLPLEEL